MSGILRKKCNYCKVAMKKQTIGLNSLYYCPDCGTMITANILEMKEGEMLHHLQPISSNH